MTGPVIDDLRFAVRYVRRRPLFAVAVTATLAVSIAAATTAFGLATAVLWRPLPYDDASKLVFVWEAPERDGQRAPSRVTGSRYAEWRDTSKAFASMSLFGAAGFSLDTAAGASSIRGVRVSAGYFDTLGIRAMLGRTFARTRARSPDSQRHAALPLRQRRAERIRDRRRRAERALPRAGTAGRRECLHEHATVPATGLLADRADDR